MTVHPCNPSTQEAEAGGYHGVQGWLGSQGEIVCPNKNNETLKLKKKKRMSVEKVCWFVRWAHVRTKGFPFRDTLFQN